MKTIAEYTDLLIPSYAMSYLVNDDASGITEEDKQTIDVYMAQFYDEAKEKGGHVCFDCASDAEPHFTWRPEFGLACEVMPCSVLILGNS